MKKHTNLGDEIFTMKKPDTTYQIEFGGDQMILEEAQAIELRDLLIEKLF